MMKNLSGYKTYIVAILIGCLAAARALGYDIPEEAYAALSALGLAALRDSVAKSNS